MDLALYSYSGAALAYGFFMLLLLTSWRASLQGKLLTLVIFISTLWAVVAADIATDEVGHVIAYQVIEVLRYMAWYVFLLKLFDTAAQPGSGYQKFLGWALPLSVGWAAVVLVGDVFFLPFLSVSGVTGHVVMALIGLAIIEQLFRNTAARHRWAIKYLFIGAGGIFAFDFYQIRGQSPLKEKFRNGLKYKNIYII